MDSTMTGPADPPADTDRLTIPPTVLIETWGDGLVVLNSRTNAFVELDATAAAMWRAIERTGSRSGAIGLLLARFAVAEDQLREDFDRICARLREHDLVTSTDEPAEAGEPEPGSDPLAVLRERYLDLVTRAVSGFLTVGPASASPNEHLGLRAMGSWQLPFTPDESPRDRLSLVGLARLQNVRDLTERALADGVPGDLVETGVWRGGVVILMRAVLAAHGIRDRRVWAVDSFEGLPVPDLITHPQDAGWANLAGALAVSQAEVAEAAQRYGLLDDQLRFLPGWFADTLPAAPIGDIAVLRLDGDLYSSTMDVLDNLYPKVSPGGFVIVDDYRIASCREAVHAYRDAHGITAEIMPIDWDGVWWRKEA